MAKPRKKRSGVWTLMVQFQSVRRQLTLGKISKPQANYFAVKVERLIDFSRNGGASMPSELQSWIETLHRDHKHRLSELGLFGYYTENLTVAQLLKLYLDDYKLRTDVTKSTITKVASTIRNRFKRIAERRLIDIEPRKKSLRMNAKAILSPESTKILTDFNSWQRNYLAVATWSRDNKLLRSIGRFAVDRGYCDFNPFDSLPSESMVNSERNAAIPIPLVLDAMDSVLEQDTRLVMALARFSAFRTPSEVRTLKWEHVDFERGQIKIFDSKKKQFRTMPIFDRVKDELERQLRLTKGERYVASELLRSNSDSDNYNRIKAAIRRSGQKKPWDRLRQNLRSSCENDLLEIFPERLVAVWVGHTVRVSREHYQKQRDSTYTNAVERARESNFMEV